MNSTVKRVINSLVAVVLIALLNTPMVHGQAEVYIVNPPEQEVSNRLQGSVNKLIQVMNGTDSISDESLSELKASEQFKSDILSVSENAKLTVEDSNHFLQWAIVTNGSYELRGLPIQIDPDKKDSIYTEIAVITLNKNGELEGIRWALEQNRYQELLKQGKTQLDSQRRQMILEFIENYRTAYHRKDLEFIKRVFSDQALIVVGRVIKKKEKSSFSKQVEYLKFTKKEYVDRLERIFKANEWIDITFKNVEIILHPVHDLIYGVNLEQSYRSSTYSDEGYLFLLIDFRDKSNPIIHVRTWQKKKNTDVEDVFRLGDIEIL